MKILIVLLCLGLAPHSIWASDNWYFSDRVAVSGSETPGIFHHLDGAGRKHIAVSDGAVSVIWEDNRTSDPQIYAAMKAEHKQQFSPALTVSTGQEAYEPSITGLSDGLFVLAWEQGSAVYARTLHNQQLGELLKLSSNTASHVSIISQGQQAIAVWREQQGRDWSLWVARLKIQKHQLQLLSKTQIEKSPLKTPVLFPSISASAAGVCVAWEDRRSGHTRLLFSYSHDGGLTFNPPESLNEFFSNRNPYDKGNGVTRVSMSAFAGDEVLAAWMDKRRGMTGYGIFAALGSDGGESFGPNEKVHGQKGDEQPHYNPATAGNGQGDFVVAWDDFRSGDSDIWLSRYNEDGEWGEDFNPAAASGTGEQSNSSVALDDDGGLHLLWIERADPLAPTRLWYTYGSAKK